MKNNQNMIWNGLPTPDVTTVLHETNPWWTGKPGRKLPDTPRHLVRQIQLRIDAGLAPVVVVKGPRQIGKTTAQLHFIENLLKSGVEGNKIFRIQFDEMPRLRGSDQPIFDLVKWYETFILKQTLNQASHAGQMAYIFLDEVQNVVNWAPQIKFIADHSDAHFVVTGSSALRIERGRDSLAGRITSIDAGVLSLTEIGMFYNVDRLSPFIKDNGDGAGSAGQADFWQDLASYGRKNRRIRDLCFEKFAERGGYPLCHKESKTEWGLLAEQLVETVIRRVIIHDLRVGDKGRKRDQDLLEEVFRMACRYIGQTPSKTKLADDAKATLGANVGVQRIQHYLSFLEETLLLRLIKPLEIRLKRVRSSDKICLADHALRAAWLQEIVPLTPRGLEKNDSAATLAGHVAESIAGVTLCSIPGLNVAYIPDRGAQKEIDFVITSGLYRIPIEVKFKKHLSPADDTRAIRTFMDNEHNNAPFGLLITRDDSQNIDIPGVIALPLSSFLLLR